MKITLIGLAAAPLLALLLITTVQAQPYPSRPIKMNVTTLPGGAPDIVARVVGQKLAEALGQQVVVENRPGSNGNIAADATAKAPPDGHTLMVCAEAQLVINPHLYAKLPYDALKDLTVIATLVSNEFVLAINPALPAKNFREFVAFARTSNPTLNYASGGNGSQHHLTMEMLKSRAGIKLVHVPYKGGTAAATATVSGEVAAVFAGSSSAPQIKAGRLRALAVASVARSKLFPDLPTIGEFYPGFSNSIWLAMCGPAGLPESIVTRLRTEVNKLLAQPDTKERFSNAGALEPFITTPDQLTALIRSEYAKYGKVVKDIGAKVD
ncbi:MAG: tripartite tricarboxylate transporter substrate binding protein [Burkholderiales bacterium]